MAISFLRTIILYIFISLSLRLMGKRQIGEFQPSELVITILISELAAVAMQDMQTPIIAGVLPMFTLVSAEILISVLCMKSIRFRKFLNGNPCIVIENGKIDQKKLFELRLTIDEILEELRLNSINDISEVKFAILETNGQLSCLLQNEARPLTSGELKSEAKKSSIPFILISDGKKIDQNMKKLNKNEKWLKNQIKKQNIESIKSVFLMTCDEYDNVFLQKKESN